jgi:hypothetical protein
MYIERAQPAVDAYCVALADSGHADQANQLRADTMALAQQIRADQQTRLDQLRVEAQITAAARRAIDLAAVVLNALEAERAAAASTTSTATSQPAP